MDGVTPGPDDRPGHRRHLRRAPDPDRRRHRHPRALHLRRSRSYAALSNGVTTFWGGGIGPTDGTNGVTIDHRPVEPRDDAAGRRGPADQLRLPGQGQLAPARARWSSRSSPARPGFKIHEDWGTTPAAIRRRCLRVADEYDVAGHHPHRHPQRVAGSSRTPSPRSTAGRSTPSTARAPAAATRRTCSRSSASPTCCPARPTRRCPTASTRMAELFDMIMVCHNLNPKIPSDVAFAESRVRAETIAAENVLHDLGAISMISQRLAGDGPRRRDLAARHPDRRRHEEGRGPLPEDAPGNDNFRVLRYVAKVTINPAITAGIAARPRLDRAGQDGRPRALGAGLLRRQAEDGPQGRHDHLGRSWATRTPRCRPASR